MTMTDNRTTELLDGLRNVGNLHEFAELFGFDWHDESDWTWHDVAVKMADDFEQAIAATLGSGTCEERGTLTADDVRDLIERHSDESGGNGRDFHNGAYKAIADELNTRAELTCKPSWVLQGETQTQEFWRCECGNCGECFGVEDRSSFPFKMTIGKVEIPNFCQKCGCKVVDE